MLQDEKTHQAVMIGDRVFVYVPDRADLPNWDVTHEAFPTQFPEPEYTLPDGMKPFDAFEHIACVNEGARFVNPDTLEPIYYDGDAVDGPF
ncbi:hypothetical protein [Tumebacillus permanentifrigoris]|uniref:Uncharacterized protein n=1 Tax=Tumebacillus permanentifrigoris TaxID=378543 RepID=A0A316D637_9BACL|nr:hypothetical protein [Tumebacillus permanentifrigoris]PWK10196.1 hypothetical protein C7459_11217 [Tumebacillus permanentifrigoris]